MDIFEDFHQRVMEQFAIQQTTEEGQPSIAEMRLILAEQEDRLRQLQVMTAHRDIESEVAEMLSEQIREEVDRDVINHLRVMAEEPWYPPKRMSEEDAYLERLGL